MSSDFSGCLLDLTVSILDISKIKNTHKIENPPRTFSSDQASRKGIMFLDIR